MRLPYHEINNVLRTYGKIIDIKKLSSSKSKHVVSKSPLDLEVVEKVTISSEAKSLNLPEQKK